jgi:hypothetical protein
MDKRVTSIVPPVNNEQYKKTNFHTSDTSPKTLWVIHNPISGPLFFLSKREAEKKYKALKKQHLYDKNEEFEKMSKPMKYILDKSKIRKFLKMNPDNFAA